MDMTRKLTKDLIEMYWERKCLWQVNSKEYKKRDMKKKAYQEMVVFLRTSGVRNANVKLVREKIQNLRRAMRKEKKRIDDTGGAYSPTLWYYDLLSFVNDQYEDTAPICESKQNTVEYTEFTEELYSEDNDESNRINKNKEEEASSGLSSKGPGEFEALGINIAAKLKRMQIKQQIYAELLIQKVLARGLLGQLNDTTEIIDLLKKTV